MTDNSPVFLDANVLIYALDKTSTPFEKTVAIIQDLLARDTQLCTSHHVIEEVLHIIKKLQPAGVTTGQVVEEIANIPDLVLIEPSADIDFARRYAALSEQLNIGINDSLLLQLMLDSGINRLFSYDAKFAGRSSSAGIKNIV